MSVIGHGDGAILGLKFNSSHSPSVNLAVPHTQATRTCKTNGAYKLEGAVGEPASPIQDPRLRSLQG